MNGQQLLMGVGYVDEKYIDEAENIKKAKKPIRIWKGIAIAACFSLILTGAFIVSFHQFTKETPTLPNDSDIAISNPSNDDTHPDMNDNTQEIQICMRNIYVNEISGLTDSSRVLPDPSSFCEVIWNKEEIINYYGRDLTPYYIPEGLKASPYNDKATVYSDSDNMMLEDTVWQSFYSDYDEDGSPRPKNGTPIPIGFTIAASRLGILNDCIYSSPGGQPEITTIEDIEVIVGYQKASYGPYDSETHDPAGYYDMYVISFSVAGTDYQFVFEQVELEEAIKVVTSFITETDKIEISY